MSIGPIPIGAPAGSSRRVSPTDIAQFIRLEQCERYLRLRLYERNVDGNFMRDYGVTPQSIPPLLTRSGTRFEDQIESDISNAFETVDFGPGQRDISNDVVVQLARDLLPGQIAILFQPRLQVEIGGWLIRGDIDLLRFERDGTGRLRALIADMKSSTSVKVEHRLQVAFYLEMLNALFDAAGVECAEIDMAVLFRGAPAEADLSPEQAAQRELQFDAAERVFRTRRGLLEVLSAGDRASYRGSVADLLTADNSTAARVSGAEFDAVPYHLTYKCDGCLFNEFCMKWSAEHDDLSLLPHLRPEEKGGLQRAGVRTMAGLAAVKQPPQPGSSELVPAPGKEALVRTLATTWPLGPRLDETIHRARRYRKWRGDDIDALTYIPSKGYGSLPYSDAGHNPNLIRVYIDAQHDYLQDRIYMLGSLVVASEGGQETPQRRRSVVHLAEGPPVDAKIERDLFVRWVDETMRAIVDLAASDPEGLPRAPIHLIFYNSFEQRLLLEGLARHFTSILGATPLYDFITQLAAFDSPVATYLDHEIREMKNYPMLCQSLQAVAAFRQFDWNGGQPYRDIFRVRMFDFWRKFDDPPEGERDWYTGRARFNSQIPLEYVYAAWGELEPPEAGKRDEYASYRGATPDVLCGFHARRLDALEWVAKDFKGNKQTEKRNFDLPNLATFRERADTWAQALDEFVTLERHVDLSAWKTARLAPPERRVLSGETLIARYLEADQDPEVVERNRTNQECCRREQLWRDANPGVRKGKAQADLKWSQDGMRFRLRLECAGLDCDLGEMLGLSSLRERDSVVVFTRTTVDSRLPIAEQQPFTPTPKQMLYGPRGTIVGFTVERDAAGRPRRAWVEVEMTNRGGNQAMRGFAFGAIPRPFVQGECYTLDSDPNDWYGYFCAKVTEELAAGGVSALHDRMTDPAASQASWPAEAADGQGRFLAGLDALHRAGLLDPFEPSKREYIGQWGDAPTLLVQGPPGTGKSFTTAYALFARLQGAMAANRDFRAILSCKTHAALDVLLAKVVEVQRDLRKYHQHAPELFATYFDPRLLDVPLFRVQPRDAAPEGALALHKKDDRSDGQPLAVRAIEAERWCVAAATPGGIYRTIKDSWKDLCDHHFCDCLILDEASQMNLPEAVMASLPLKQDGQLIVVGDHRQMPPIIKHDWGTEARQTFKEFRAYESLFLALLPLDIPHIKFSRSFRLHADMAEFLRREIYHLDGIDYHSLNRQMLRPAVHPDPFVNSVLEPDHTLVVVVHDEAASLQRNAFEQALIAPVLEALASSPYNLDPRHGLGVVVPHRAQRASLRDGIPALNQIDPQTGAISLSAVDTVERFQGDEREVIMVSATESDRAYLLLSGDFLLDPRRLTVALSRAKHKMILVASQSVFSIFSADEETFAHAQLWKNLLRTTCTQKLWEGEREGHRVQVWGNVPSQ